MLLTPDRIRTLQRKLYCKAKQEPDFRFYSLYDKVYRADILGHAYRLARANKGAPGIDGVSFKSIEKDGGEIKFVQKLEQELKEKQYRCQPVRRVWIPKPDGSQRPLGIPTIRDRVVQMAVKLVIEPIFEADFCDSSYGFRPKRSAHDAVDAISEALLTGHRQVVDADLSKYFDTIPHSKLLTVVATMNCRQGDTILNQAMAQSAGCRTGWKQASNNWWRQEESVRHPTGRSYFTTPGKSVSSSS